MKSNHLLIKILLTSLLYCSISFAQSQNTGGRFRGGGSSSGAYSPNGNLTQPLRDPAVHDELDLEDAQVKTIERETKALADIEQQLRLQSKRQRIIEAGQERMVREVLTEEQQAKFKAAKNQANAK